MNISSVYKHPTPRKKDEMELLIYRTEKGEKCVLLKDLKKLLRGLKK